MFKSAKFKIKNIGEKILKKNYKFIRKIYKMNLKKPKFWQKKNLFSFLFFL